jgi:hypothetical protein
VDSDPDQWLRQHPNVAVVLRERPEGDWRAQAGWGWIAKIRFRSWRDSRAASDAISEQGWKVTRWGRKVRVGIEDGYDGQKLADFVLARWPEVPKIQLRCD